MIDQLKKIKVGECVVLDTIFPGISDEEVYLDVVERVEDEGGIGLGFQLTVFGIGIAKFVATIINDTMEVKCCGD